MHAPLIYIQRAQVFLCIIKEVLQLTKFWN